MDLSKPCGILEPEMANLRSLVQTIFNINNYRDTSDHIADITVLNLDTPIGQNPWSVVSVAVDLESGISFTASPMLTKLRHILHMQSNYEEACHVLKKAWDQFVRIGDELGAGSVSQSLGNILCSSQLWGGCHVHPKVRPVYGIVINLVQPQCSQSLGDILRMQSNYEKAANVLKRLKTSHRLAISVALLNAHKA